MPWARNRSTRCVPRKPAPPVTTVLMGVSVATSAARSIQLRSKLRLPEPIDSSQPALSVRRVPGDRPRDAFFPRHLGLSTGLTLELLVADAKRQYVARARPEAMRYGCQSAPSGPVTIRFADLDDLLGPVLHRDVLALSVDVEIAGDSM